MRGEGEGEDRRRTGLCIGVGTGLGLDLPGGEEAGDDIAGVRCGGWEGRGLCLVVGDADGVVEGE